MTVWTKPKQIPAALGFSLGAYQPDQMTWYVSRHNPHPKIAPTRTLRFVYLFGDPEDFGRYLADIGMVCTLTSNNITHQSKIWPIYMDLPQLLFVTPQVERVPYKSIDKYSPTEIRALAVQKGARILNEVKQMKLIKADEAQLQAVQGMLDETHRAQLLSYVGELIELERDNEIRPLTQMERLRIALLKTCEMIGLVEFVTNQGRMDDQGVQGYINIARMLGNEGQRQLDETRLEIRKPDSVFDKLAGIAKAQELTFRNGKTVDADFKEKPADKSE